MNSRNCVQECDMDLLANLLKNKKESQESHRRRETRLYDLLLVLLIKKYDLLRNLIIIN